MAPQQSPPEVQQEKNRVIGASLYGDDNSLYKESLKRLPKDGIQDIFDIEDFSGVVRKGNPNGWGIAEYPSGKPYVPPLILKSAAPVVSDPNYPKSVLQTLAQSPNLLLAHVRQATPGFRDLQVTNSHPFSFQEWSLVHNGTITGALSAPVAAKINQYRPVLGNGPKGDTDSERALYYYLARLHETAGSIDAAKVPLATKQWVFANSIHEMITYSHPDFKPLKKDVMDVSGHVLMQPACNLIMSDGENILAFRKVMDLFLGEKILSNGQRMYMLSSERMFQKDPTFKWATVPVDHIVTISRDETGNPCASFEPMLEFIQPPEAKKVSV